MPLNDTQIRRAKPRQSPTGFSTSAACTLVGFDYQPFAGIVVPVELYQVSAVWF